MNIHHLELFYYVAKHGGISEAVRNIPYGIQQPAVSGQVIQLEEYLGVTLFQRRPFALTPEGEELYAFIQPFFSNLDNLADKLKGGVEHHIRIGASEALLREHIPDLVTNVRRKFPRLKVSLRESNQPQLKVWLEQGELDILIGLIPDGLAPTIHAHLLAKLSVVLLVPKGSRIKSASELWQRDKIEEPLICLPANEIICRHFQAALERLNVDWFPSIEVTSLGLVEAYVEKGFGIGLSIRQPGESFSNKVRVIELPEVEELNAGILHRGEPTELVQSFMNETLERMRRFEAGELK
jgi:DNA-binding transcriptional LysR family regulator